MSEEITRESNSSKAHAGKAKSITYEMFIDHLKEIGFGDNSVKCQVCGGHEFTAPIGPDRGDEIKYPLIITSPLPTKEGLGVWSFPIFCNKCSNTLYFNVGNIVKNLEKEGKIVVNND